MRILVIDDKQEHIKSACETLSDHDVVTANSISQAWNILDDEESFDAVLTDLHLPRGDWSGAVSFRQIEDVEELPAGLVFALRAVNEGVRTVIYTDKHHHNDWICGLLDLVGNRRTSERDQELVAYVEADVYDNSPKDWERALVHSGLFKEKGYELTREDF